MMLVGKFVVAYVPSCREKEYYIACACEEIYAPPSAYFSLFGLTVQAGFVRGTLILLFIASFYTKFDF
jgi:protease-4